MLGPGLQCCLLATLYVSLMHSCFRGRRRNDPTIIRWRMISSCAVCAIAWVPLWLELKRTEPVPEQQWKQLLGCLGLKMSGIVPAIAIPFGLTALLYLGPLAMAAIDWIVPNRDTQARPFKTKTSCITPNAGDCKRDRPTRQTWIEFARDVVVSPVTEEFVFRACMVPLMLLRGYAVKSVIALVPLYFGAAHLHHLYELVKLQRIPFARALQKVVGQLLYSTVFGAYAAWLLIRTGNLAALITVHTLCNSLGFPDFDALSEHKHQPLLSAAVGAGVLLFSILLKPATAPAIYAGPQSVPGLVLS